MALAYHNYSSNYPQLFEKMKGDIQSLCKKKLDIQHVGSTSVPGLGGKGIIDIQIGINSWAEADDVVKALKRIGFKDFHPIENHNLFVANKDVSEEGDFHIHICRKGTIRHKRTLFFRDYLRNHPEEAKKYQTMKQAAFQEAQGDRKLFKKLKNIYYFENFNFEDSK